MTVEGADTAMDERFHIAVLTFLRLGARTTFCSFCNFSGLARDICVFTYAL